MRTLVAPLVACVSLIACATTPSGSDSVAYIEVVARGESALRLEQAVTIPLEQSLNALGAVRRVRSTTSEGIVKVEVDFSAPPTADQVRQVETTVADAVQRFPIKPSSVVVSVGHASTS